MDFEDAVIITEDNTEYLIVKKVQVDNRTYAYISNKADESDGRVVELIEGAMRPVENHYLVSVVLPALLKED